MTTLRLLAVIARTMMATRGLSAVDFANKVLNHMLRAVASTAPAGQFVKLHLGDPGSAGTANASSVTTRPSLTFSAASAGACASSNTPSWTNWAGTSPETISDISVWDASTAGTFEYSIALTANKVVQTGDTLTLTSVSVSLAPIAA
jgi:type IV secretory pathway TrbL component